MKTITYQSNNSEAKENIQKLIELKKLIYKEIYSHEDEIKQLKNRLYQIENIIMGMCTHEWEYEWCNGMYDKSEKVCKFCESRIF